MSDSHSQCQQPNLKPDTRSLGTQPFRVPVPRRLLYLEAGKRLDDVAYNATEPKLADIRSVVYLVSLSFGHHSTGRGSGRRGLLAC